MARILIIEDSPANMKLTVVILSSAGYMLLTAENAKDGIDIALRERPDLILMDMHLPDMNGIEATRILKMLAETAHIPVVALTASAMVGDRERMLQAGCDGYVEKPISYKEFLGKVAEFCNRQG